MITIAPDASPEAVVRTACGLLFRPDRAEIIFNRLQALHAGRPYHGLSHLAFMIRHWARLAHLLRYPLAVLLAIILHDAIYDTRAPHGANEEASARLCESMAGDLIDPSLAPPAARMVRSTADHRADDADDAALLDLDLAILSTDEATFDSFDSAVRIEYAHVSDADWRLGRAHVLRSFLARERIYLTPTFAPHEAAARRNLERALARLESA